MNKTGYALAALLMLAAPREVADAINSWNEWTETSYLQPDDVNGYGYLEAVKKVFNP